MGISMVNKNRKYYRHTTFAKIPTNIDLGGFFIANTVTLFLAPDTYPLDPSSMPKKTCLSIAENYRYCTTACTAIEWFPAIAGQVSMSREKA